MEPKTWEKSLAMFQGSHLLNAPIQLSDVVDYSVLQRVYPQSP
jgi:hypothetical protein